LLYFGISNRKAIKPVVTPEHSGKVEIKEETSGKEEPLRPQEESADVLGTILPLIRAIHTAFTGEAQETWS
jgi:hypothetical protein